MSTTLSLRRTTLLICSVASAAAVAAVLAGCERTPADPVGGELVRSETFPRDTDRILMRQAAAGAASDRTLYDHHFHADELNSLGENKLRLMLEDTGFLAEPRVYIATGASNQSEAVRRYLAQAGLATESARIHSGTDPQALRPVALGLQQRAETDSNANGQNSGGAGTQR